MASEVARPAKRPLADRASTMWLVTAAFGLVLVFWAVLTPLYGAPDEIAHVDSAIRVAQVHTWPAPGEAHYLSGVTYTKFGELQLRNDQRSTFAEIFADRPGISPGIDQMTQHPPLFYLMAAVVLKLVHFMDLRWDIVVMILRYFDILLVLPLPWLVFASVKRALKSPKIALLGAVSLFFVPQLQQIVSAVSNDSLAVLLGAVTAWLMIRFLTGAQRVRDVVFVSIALGLFLLTKGTAVPAVPFVALGLLFARRVVPVGWGRRILDTLLGGAVAGVIGGWWFVRNIVLYHDIQPSGLAGQRPTITWPEGEGRDLGNYMQAFWDTVTGSFWGRFGGLQYPMTPYLTDLLTAVSLLVVAAFAFRRGAFRRDALLIASFPVVTLLLLIANTWRVYGRTALVYGVQGRYFYIAIVALIVISAIAWSRAVVEPKTKLLAARAVVIGAPAVTVYGLSLEYRGAYEKLHLAFHPDGAYTWAYSSAVGPHWIALVVALTAVVGLVAVIWCFRAVSQRVLPEESGLVREAVLANEGNRR
ncbi:MULTISPECIES: DUF2142 domain-containing protein [unclassified Frondihabitans]|uniref:DUF2142 domain-containing protein n=1 Tax=unclassified Frondihabitans TaxID=2626248 RepID=UPI000F4FC3D1|nr:MULTISPECIES: DUF2142 domain-containing protein [unclassified Frondihabitans]RPE79064.1 dolichyl-phosphate-mannose-protein mannosyltransferase [Frondihabitans sp. PhB153]RPF09344.1 dolichyl-phosphate-mannose-protein mannosyltransferase [Frondihabitans sp. PhB161]